MDIDTVKNSLSFGSWFSDKTFGTTYQKALSLYYELKEFKFAPFHLYRDMNLNYAAFLVCIGAGYFKRSKDPKLRIIFLHINSHYGNRVNGWTVYDTESYKECTYSFDKFIDMDYMENDLIYDDRFFKEFTSNFRFD